MPAAKAPQPAVPSDDPGATGRTGGSRTTAPAGTPAAPRGRGTTDRTDNGHAPGDGRSPGLGQGDRGDRAVSGTGGASGTEHPPAADGAVDGPAGQLLGGDERGRLGERLHHALAGFVDSPHDSVAEAAEVLEDAEHQLIAALRDRRAALRAGWQTDGDPGGVSPDTEQLRLTLRTYREVTERLLRA
ncbi:hypothetical protein M5362_32430 [Streptomyces sp. Je 1-79]|uniref:hypothetical protein n=1 Tax=Streptomyces sp. Je 1-79 TaxID=2943847 RepID=UPI0021A2D9B8|nr:hypothetical protein [Streptomyces sp. Je 1-79]MCT4357815.1 hypothetical protein [Streptomyces sp. Je 1-79]